MFGREKEMDFGQLSERGGRPDPVPGSDGAAATGAEPRGPYEPGRLALALFTLAVLAAAAFMFVTVEGEAVDDPVKQAQRGEIGTNDPLSLVLEPNTARAVRAVDAELRDGGYIDSFRLAPTSVNAIVVQPDGRRQSVAVNVAFETTTTDAGTGDGEGLQPEDIDPEAPERIVRVARRKFDLQPRNLDYMVANKPFREGEDSSWTAFWKLPLKDNDVAAAADGTDVRRLGTPDAKSRAATKAAQESAARQQQQAAERSQCLSRAEGVEAVQRCLR